MSATSRGTNHAWRRWFVVALAGVGVLATVALVLVDPFDPATDSPVDLIGDLAFVASLLAFIVSGSAILIRRPDNPIGWLLLVPGVVLPASEVTTRWLTALGPPSELTPALWLILWATGWSWVVLAFGCFHLLLTFPTGRLLTRRWRWAVALEAVLIGTVAVIGAVTDRIGPTVEGAPTWTVDNPLGLVRGDVFDGVVGLAWGVGLVTITVLSAVALVLRFRRGTPDEREQLKWPAAAAVLFGVIYGVSVLAAVIPGAPREVEALLGFGLAAIPVSVAVAVLRYRLYEIDRIISRTISWALVTGVLLLAFAVPVLGLQAAVADLTQGQTLVVAVSTLLAAALFQPVRIRVQRAVDRRFDRARYDGEQVVAAFGDRLRDHVDLDMLSAEVRRVADETVRPMSSTLWLRTPGVSPRNQVS